jgi:hypothetical protein
MYMLTNYRLLEFGSINFVQRQVWKYQRGSQQQLIAEWQTIQWPKKKDKRTNNHLQNITQKTKDRATWTPLKSLSWSHHFESFMVATMTWLTITEYLSPKWPWICPFVVITIRSFRHSWLITRFLTRVTRRVPGTAYPSGAFEEGHITLQSASQRGLYLGMKPDGRVWPTVDTGVKNICLVVCSFVLFLWPLCCLSFFDLLVLITPLVSSNSSFIFLWNIKTQ